LAHVYCGQTAGWTTTPVGTEVDDDPGHIVLDWVQAPAKGAQQPPHFISAHVYCGHGRPSQLLLSSCISFQTWFHVEIKLFEIISDPSPPPLVTMLKQFYFISDVVAC